MFETDILNMLTCLLADWRLLYLSFTLYKGYITIIHFVTADCSNGPGGNLTAEVAYNGYRFPADVTEDKPDVYRISFRPRGPGTYRIWVVYDGTVVKGMLNVFLAYI